MNQELGMLSTYCDNNNRDAKMNTYQTMPLSDLSRTDKDVAVAVNRGLIISMFKGIAAGAAFMRAEGVPLAVSTRVLISPEQRRTSDWK
jgi:hypothetical protein